jgi:hypothetical protein
LQQTLNVNLSHVESRVGEIIKHDHSRLALLHGEIIERSYMEHLCEEVNDLVEEAGQASLAELSKSLGLPINFLIKHIEVALDNKSIRGHLDKADTGIIYTETYINRYKSRVRGVFHAITVPVPISSIIEEGRFQDTLFNSVVQRLLSNKELAGDLQGRQDKAVYIPHVYVRNQNNWVDSFLGNNGYLEYDALSRLGISNPQTFVYQRYSGDVQSSNLVLLSSCCVGKTVIGKVEGALEEMLTSGMWADIMPLLPSPCTLQDAGLLLHHIQNSQPDLQVFGSVAATKFFLHNCFECFKPAIFERAQRVCAFLCHSLLVQGSNGAAASKNCK